VDPELESYLLVAQLGRLMFSYSGSLSHSLSDANLYPQNNLSLTLHDRHASQAQFSPELWFETSLEKEAA
jgi:hypothetical protein